MGGDEELRMPGCGKVVNDLEERELPLRRERRLGFVQEVDALLEAVSGRF